MAPLRWVALDVLVSKVGAGSFRNSVEDFILYSGESRVGGVSLVALFVPLDLTSFNCCCLAAG